MKAKSKPRLLIRTIAFSLFAVFIFAMCGIDQAPPKSHHPIPVSETTQHRELHLLGIVIRSEAIPPELNWDGLVQLIPDPTHADSELFCFETENNSPEIVYTEQNPNAGIPPNEVVRICQPYVDPDTLPENADITLTYDFLSPDAVFPGMHRLASIP